MLTCVFLSFLTYDAFSEYVAEWQDPPYPRKDKLYNALKHRIHWKHDDDSFSCSNPQVNDPQINDFSEFEPEVLVDEESYDEDYYQDEFRES